MKNHIRALILLRLWRVSRVLTYMLAYLLTYLVTYLLSYTVSKIWRIISQLTNWSNFRRRQEVSLSNVYFGMNPYIRDAEIWPTLNKRETFSIVWLERFKHGSRV